MLSCRTTLRASESFPINLLHQPLAFASIQLQSPHLLHTRVLLSFLSSSPLLLPSHRFLMKPSIRFILTCSVPDLLCTSFSTSPGLLTSHLLLSLLTPTLFSSHDL
mmetsp:Transcript_44260/g.139633  ORF Transcript_44260/g.139633 Transcript_44260/m.139633 type:complete len:106 (+) Transcript_44260:378-695(+)